MRVNPIDVKLDRLATRMAALCAQRDVLLEQKAREAGFTPCDDCVQGWCSMNCSSAPAYIKAQGWL